MFNEQIPMIQEKSKAGRRGVLPPSVPVEKRQKVVSNLPDKFKRKTAPSLPEVSELEGVRHFTRLSQKNYSIDGQFYPLGSCTMKYNPRVNEAMAAKEEFAQLHPLTPDEDCQGMLGVYFDLQEILKEVLGLGAVTLAPAAGAQGEFTGMAIIKAWQKKNAPGRTEVIVPDSAHGTNPASAVLAGFDVKVVKTGDDGCVDLISLREAISEKTAAIMLTNPNTCGVFEKDIIEMSNLIHEAGGLLYYDGANLNAIVGKCRPGDMGFDVCHINLHKTFSTPHGGGGPGAGPVGVTKELEEFLPEPHVRKNAEGNFERFRPSESIGKLHAFQGNAGVIIRALSYSLMQGGEGLRDVATFATLNANYLLNKLPDVFEKPFGKLCKHEALVSVRGAEKQKGIKAFDVAKRLLDLGFHAPTIYFPIHVPECLLIEPTECESIETLDRFIDAMDIIANEIDKDPDILHSAPNDLPTGRLDEASAARQLNVCCDWGSIAQGS